MVHNNFSHELLGDSGRAAWASMCKGVGAPLQEPGRRFGGKRNPLPNMRFLLHLVSLINQISLALCFPECSWKLWAPESIVSLSPCCWGHLGKGFLIHHPRPSLCSFPSLLTLGEVGLWAPDPPASVSWMLGPQVGATVLYSRLPFISSFLLFFL